MATFHYEALDAAGRTKKGVLTADSQRLARQELKKTGLLPVSLEPVTAEKGGTTGARKRIREGDLVLATRQMATLVDASMPVEEALQAVSTEMDRPGIRQIFLSIRERVMEGWKMSDALAEHPRSFSALFRGVIASGEASGEFGKVLSRLADMLEKNRAIRMKALMALIYPAFLLIVMLMVISGLMIFVIPKIVEQFDTLGGKLPFLTRAVIGISDFLANWGLWLLLALVAGMIGFSQGLRLPAFRLGVDRFVLRLPIIGNLARQLDAARFSRTLATLTAAGTPLLPALQAARQTVVNRETDRRIASVVTGVSEGAALSGAIRKSAAFPPMLSYMIAAGERSGDMSPMLEKTAATMESEFDTVITLALRLIEPLIIIIMGALVLCIVLAIMLPILQINTLTTA